jgi:transposase
MDQVCVGIDVSKDRLDIHIRPSDEAFALPRSSDGLDTLIERLRHVAAQLIVLEATGGFETVVAAALGSAGLPLAIINPRRIRHFAKALGLLAKTDRLDAAVIARFAETVRPPVRLLPDAEAHRLGELVARRRQIVGMMTAERNRKRQLSDVRLLRTVERVIETLQEQLSVVEVEIDTAIRGNPVWAELDALLETAPGIGPKIARTCIAELPELGRLSRRQIGALAGVVPFSRDSGRRHGQRAIDGGRPAVRGALFMAVMVSIRRNLPLAAFYERLRARGKPAKVAIVATMRKLLTILNAMVRDNTPWRPA